MPRLFYYCLLYTDGRAPTGPMLEGSEFKLVELAEVPRPPPGSELFGPHVHELEAFVAEARAAYLLYGSREVRRDAGTFFGVAHGLVARSVEGVSGFGLDVLKLWPFPLDRAADLPEDPLAEDLFSVGFSERPDEVFRAESYGLAKLGQREICFEFTGRDLLDEATLMCARLADYAASQGRRVEHGQTMSFGFDRLAFAAAEGAEAGGRLRGWHAPFVQRALPEEVFPGVGLLEVSSYVPMSERTIPDLTDALCRSFEQRQIVESAELSGESPHQGTTVNACACAGRENGLRGVRRDPDSVRDSGWTFTCAREPSGKHEVGVEPLGTFARRVPQVMKYLALPPGSVIEWKGQDVVIDSSAAAETDGGDAPI